MAQARFQSTSIYPIARAAAGTCARISNEITQSFEEYLNEHLKEDAKRSSLHRKLFGSISSDFSEGLKQLPPMNGEIAFADAWHQFKASYNDSVEEYNKFAAIAAAIADGHALEITMDVKDFVQMQSYAEKFAEEE